MESGQHFSFFSFLNLGQVLGRADRNCGEWIALLLFSGLNLGQVLGRADRNFFFFLFSFFLYFLPFFTFHLFHILSPISPFFFTLSFSHSFSLSHFPIPQPCRLTLPSLTFPHLTFPLLYLTQNKGASRFSADFCSEKFLPTQKG